MTASGVGRVRQRAGPSRRSSDAEADVHPDQPHSLADRGQVQVRGPDHAGAVDVDQLVVEHLAGQGGLALAGREIPQVQPCGGQDDLPLGTEATALAGTNARRAATLTTTPDSGGYGSSVSHRTTTSMTRPMTSPPRCRTGRPSRPASETRDSRISRASSRRRERRSNRCRNTVDGEGNAMVNLAQKGTAEWS